jgi:4-hydroxybenzoate polyprenyltransferase
MAVFNFFLNTIYYPFVKYRIHISIIFLFLLINVYSNLAKEAPVWPVIIAFFLWHYALYIFDRAYDYKKDAVNQPREAILPAERNFFLGLSFLFSILPLSILYFFGFPVLPYLPFIPITFLYTFPVYKGIRSKNILLFKNIYSALFIWTLPLAVVAFYYTQTDLSFCDIFKTYFLGLFIYVMVGEAFWDIRDVSGDKVENVKTIPVVFGVAVTKIYLILLILVDLFVFGKSVSDSTVVYVVLILVVRPDSPRWLFHIPPLLALYRFIAPLIFS